MKQKPTLSGPKHPQLVPPVSTSNVPLLSQVVGLPPPPPPRSPSTQLSASSPKPPQKGVQKQATSPFKSLPKQRSAFESEALQVSVFPNLANFRFDTLISAFGCLPNFLTLVKSKRNYSKRKAHL